MSSYVLSRVLPRGRERLDEILGALEREPSHRFALAESNDVLAASAPAEFTLATADADVVGLTPFLRSYVAAMVELAAARKGLAPPHWTTSVESLDEPYSPTPMKSLRLHLLRSSPVPFKRRNIFVDAAVGDRV